MPPKPTRKLKPSRPIGGPSRMSGGMPSVTPSPASARPFMKPALPFRGSSVQSTPTPAPRPFSSQHSGRMVAPSPSAEVERQLSREFGTQAESSRSGAAREQQQAALQRVASRSLSSIPGRPAFSVTPSPVGGSGGKSLPGPSPARRGTGGKGLGAMHGTARRHRNQRILRDSVTGITKPVIRRLARRGGVKRISGQIYEEVRIVLKSHLTGIIRDTVAYCEHGNRKTITVTDVIHALQRRGTPIYGFDKSTYEPKKANRKLTARK
ncbi:hypothetical protein H072_379 [Dactylellina haptotyla CBS 200.50]|uniref:Histone H4 n=1 Tax=Dactylellina haptotyla (strain CBS 200.50) TaxID=1284197 RepID=S8ARX7_DACHA|nr:hypothetical protein H072_379 [Dactylellina haptotyla CBS 200.50]